MRDVDGQTNVWVVDRWMGEWVSGKGRGERQQTDGRRYMEKQMVRGG
jgi:hypothetical protein